MTLTVNDIPLLGSTFAGVLMIVAGIKLLNDGKISLLNASAEDKNALTVEYKKLFKMSTGNPVIAFFSVGVGLIVIALYLREPNSYELVIEGKTVNLTEPVQISVKTGTWSSGLPHKDKIFEKLSPNFGTVQIVVSAPGYDNYTHTIEIEPGQTKTDLGDISLKQKIVISDIQSSNVIPLPEGTKIPSSTFGGAK